MKKSMHFLEVLGLIIFVFLIGYFFEYSPYVSDVLESFELITELFTIFVSFSIFGIAWYSHSESKDNNALFLGTVFFIVGLLDLFHTLSYPFMPEFITPNSPQKSAIFWIAARSISAPLLLVSAYIHRDTLPGLINKSVLSVSVFMLTFIALISVVYLDIFIESLKILFYPDESLFSVRMFLVPVTALIILYAGYLYTRRIKKTDQNNYIYLVFGFIVLIFSDTIYFTYEMSAHLLKIIAFYFVYVALYRSSVVHPYEMLAVAEEKLRHAAEEKYRNLFDNANDAIITTDADDRITSWNSSAEKIFGWTAGDVSGIKLMPLIIPSGSNPERDMVPGNIIAGGAVNSFDTACICKDGSKIDVSMTISPLRDLNNNINGISFIVRDITERKRAEEELKNYRDHLEELVKDRTAELTEANEQLILAKEEEEKASKAKSDFLSTMSHELRTPLNSILGFSELLKMKTRGELNEKQEHYVDNIITSGRSLLTLINDILDLSKIEAGKTELVIEETDVSAAINETINLIKEKALSHNVILKKEIDDQLRSIKIDQQKFKQILFNLLSNAVKFSKEEGGTVTVKAEKTGDMVRFSVSDTGIGIKEKDMKKLFNKFQQIDSGVSRKYGGTGLGLAISKQLVELHKGRITIESKYGEGSTFTFFLPLEIKDRKDVK